MTAQTRRASVRAHVVLPQELVAEVDQTVGVRHRSEFLEEAAREKLARLRLTAAAARAAGSLADVPIPGWDTSEGASAWVHNARRCDDEQRQQQPG